ncbi:MAG TPA: fumarylacetoacetase [Solirubrobacteraceae bacterium]|nr:fumarylacetoacetase [Solirubrobacteraceae bacterium]
MPEPGFGLENLPYGVVERDGRARPAVRLGDYAIDLHALGLESVPAHAFDQPSLNAFIALGRSAWTAVREEVLAAIREGHHEQHATALAHARPLLPIDIRDYVDFYASIEHASNLGRMFRPDSDPLLPNWRHLPVGYHGRAGTVVVSGTPIRRPSGQRPPAEPGGAPTFGPEPRLDIELELGFVTGDGPPLGTPIPVSAAREHVFGLVLVNDWSARAIQRWEYQPLGPFLGKSFATSISPWIVPLDALEPFRVDAPAQDPPPLDYLRTGEPWAFDLPLEIVLNDTVVSRTNARHLYWNVAQMLAHATVNGATVRAGDLFASGTISGPEPGSYGSLIELSWGGRDPIPTSRGDRTFLEDGDTVVLRGGHAAVSLGEVSGTVLPD